MPKPPRMIFKDQTKQTTNRTNTSKRLHKKIKCPSLGDISIPKNARGVAKQELLRSRSRPKRLCSLLLLGSLSARPASAHPLRPVLYLSSRPFRSNMTHLQGLIGIVNRPRNRTLYKPPGWVMTPLPGSLSRPASRSQFAPEAPCGRYGLED